jgi:hypothetical protein
VATPPSSSSNSSFGPLDDEAVLKFADRTQHIEQ